MEHRLTEGTYEKFGVQISGNQTIFTFAGEKEDTCAILFYGKEDQIIERIEVPGALYVPLRWKDFPRSGCAITTKSTGLCRQTCTQEKLSGGNALLIWNGNHRGLQYVVELQTVPLTGKGMWHRKSLEVRW